MFTQQLLAYELINSIMKKYSGNTCNFPSTYVDIAKWNRNNHQMEIVRENYLFPTLQRKIMKDIWQLLELIGHIDHLLVFISNKIAPKTTYYIEWPISIQYCFTCWFGCNAMSVPNQSRFQCLILSFQSLSMTKEQLPLFFNSYNVSRFRKYLLLATLTIFGNIFFLSPSKWEFVFSISLLSPQSLVLVHISMLQEYKKVEALKKILDCII